MSFDFDPTLVRDTYGKAGNLSANARTGLLQIVGFIHEDAEISDVRWAAYMLATAQHECANKWAPIEEFGKGKGRPYGVPVQVTDDNATTFTNTYYGRGYVQLTWRANYDRVGRAIGLGNLLVVHPEHALEPKTAYQIMSFGMRSGIFTGKKLSDFIHGTQCDYVNARKIINGLDRAGLIAGYATAWEKLLSGGQSTATAVGS